MIKFKLNGKPLEIPSSWEDLTLKQHNAIIQNKEGLPGALSILTGIDLETIKKAKFEGLNQLIQALSFLKKAPEYSGEVTKLGKYKLPLNSKGIFDVQFESLGQFEDMKALMVNIDLNNTLGYNKLCAQACAIYAQKLRDGEYNYDKSLSLLEEINEMPAKDVITAGSFFFLKLANLLTGTDQTFQTIAQNQKKSKPASKTSKRSSGRTPPSRKSR
jgi:hypothetical protein